MSLRYGVVVCTGCTYVYVLMVEEMKINRGKRIIRGRYHRLYRSHVATHRPTDRRVMVMDDEDDDRDPFIHREVVAGVDRVYDELACSNEPGKRTNTDIPSRDGRVRGALDHVAL